MCSPGSVARGFVGPRSRLGSWPGRSPWAPVTCLAWWPGVFGPMHSPGTVVGSPGPVPHAARPGGTDGRRLSTFWVWCLCSAEGLIGCPHGSEHTFGLSCRATRRASHPGRGAGEVGRPRPGRPARRRSGRAGPGAAAAGWTAWKATGSTNSPASTPGALPAPTKASRPPPPPAGSAPGCAWAPVRPAARSGPPGLAERPRAAMARLPPILGGAPSQPLEVGRTTRVVTPTQRLAVAVRDGGCVVSTASGPWPGVRPITWSTGWTAAPPTWPTWPWCVGPIIGRSTRAAGGWSASPMAA
jgi:hypothetical protein